MRIKQHAPSVLIASTWLLLGAACNVESTKPPSQGTGVVDAGSDTDDDTDDDTDAGKQPVASKPNTDDDSPEPTNNQKDSGSTGPSEPAPSDQDAGPEHDAAAPLSDSGVTSEAATAPEMDSGDSFVENEPEVVRGFFVVHSDYESVSVSVLDSDGDVLSASLISSGSESAGLSTALSGDVIVPTSTLLGREVVLLDRTNHVLTWVNLEDASVRAQLNVGPGGFAANPYDYAPYDANKAYLTRHDSNFAAGAAEFDEGGDVLIVDPGTATIAGRIDMSAVLGDDADTFLPRADALLISGGYLYASLTVADADFAAYGASRVVRIDPESDAVVDVLTVSELKNCGGLSVSPDGRRLALGCAGDWSGDVVATSGIVLVDLTGDELSVVDQFPAEALLDAQIGSLAFASNEALLFANTGSYDDSFAVVAGDSLALLNVATGELIGEPLIQTTGPYNLGEVRCATEEHMCVAADAEAGVVQHLRFTAAGNLDEVTPIEVDDGIGSPPRSIGKF